MPAAPRSEAHRGRPCTSATTVRTGAKPTGLNLIFEIVQKHGIRPDMFIPTHINRRNRRLTDQVLELARLGAVVAAACMMNLPAEDSVYMAAADFAGLADENGLFDRVAFSVVEEKGYFE